LRIGILTGKELDVNTGLIYFGQRYYDPDTARFINQDSYLGKQDTPPSLHRYLYAYSNPTVYIDLEGYAANDINSAGFPELRYRSPTATEIAPATYGLASNASKDEQERLTEYSVNTSPAKAKILGTLEGAILLAPLAPIAAEASTAAYITVESSPLVSSLAKGAGGYHAYKMLTDSEYRGEAFSAACYAGAVQPVASTLGEIKSIGRMAKNVAAKSVDGVKALSLWIKQGLDSVSVTTEGFGSLGGNIKVSLKSGEGVAANRSVNGSISNAAEKGYTDIKLTEGGGPDFSGSSYLYPTNPGQKNTAIIQMQGSYYQDFKAANKAAGFNGAKAPKDYTWHHLDDLNPVTGEVTMQLIEQGAHRATYPHKGAVSQFEKHFGIEYK